MRTRSRYIVLLALVALLAAAPPAAADLDQSDWGDICVNSNRGVGRPYVANDISLANCRVIPRIGRDRRDRRFVATVPKSALERRRIPVVIFFHGTGGTGETYWETSRWRELADREGFIVVFPSSLAYDLNNDRSSEPKTVYNVIGQACDLVQPGRRANDVAFTRAIVRDLRAQLPVDRRRIYAAGFSNGGQMVHRIAAEAGDVFAAGAAWAGPPAEGDDDGQCDADPYGPSANPIPVWAGYGSKDETVNGHISEIPLKPEAILERLPRIFEDAALLFTVGVTHGRELALDDFASYSRSVVGNYEPVWSPVMIFDPQEGSTFENVYSFVVLDDVGHKYPNARRGPRYRRETRLSQGVAVAPLQFDFFRDNPKPR